MKTIARASRTGSILLVAGPSAKLRDQWSQGLDGKYTVHAVAERVALERGLTTLQPAVLLLDLSVCSTGGVGEVPTLQALCPSTKIMLLTENPDAAEGVFALRVGAKG